jgi:hypothetical protein
MRKPAIRRQYPCLPTSAAQAGPRFTKVLSVIALLCIVQACHDASFRVDVRAMAHAEEIRNAEAVFLSRHGTYADLVTLGPGGERLLGADLAGGHADGYRFEVTLRAAGYNALASPVPGEGGFATFRWDESSPVYHYWGATKGR